MKRILSCFLVFILLFSFYPVGGENNYQIRVIDIKGKVQKDVSNPLFSLFGFSTWKKINKGDILNPGTKLRTGEDSSLEIKYDNGTSVHIGEKSRVVIGQNKKTEKGYASTLQLNEGRIWSRVERAWNKLTKFKVITPSAVAGVKGTLFSVAVKDLTVLSVKEGVVQFTEKEDENSVVVKKGMMSEASPGKLKQPSKIDKKERKQWKKKDVNNWIKKTKKSSNNPGQALGRSDEAQGKGKKKGKDQKKENEKSNANNQKENNNQGKNNSNNSQKNDKPANPSENVANNNKDDQNNDTDNEENSNPENKNNENKDSDDTGNSNGRGNADKSNNKGR